LAALRIQDLAIEYVQGGYAVRPIDGLDFSAEDGELVILLGPSGSGKTTLMRAIVGVQVIRSGAVEVLGLSAGSPELRRRVGYVTQAPSVYGDLTARENLDYFARIVEAPPGRVDEVLETVDLVRLSRRQVRSLSGGERSRVSLAAALLGRPDVLVLDEPTVGLDPVLRRDLWNTFHRLAEAGTTLLVSSHVMDEADRCDELVLIRDGRILAQSPPAELLRTTGAETLEQAFLVLIEGAS
jgi:ABC-2 type transport system ATP-binding protein